MDGVRSQAGRQHAGEGKPRNDDDKRIATGRKATAVELARGGGKRPGRGSARARKEMHIPCQTSKKHQSGMPRESGKTDPALERFAPVEVGGGAICPRRVWGDSPHPPWGNGDGSG